MVLGLNWILGACIGHLGIMGAIFSVLATLWNYATLAWRGSVLKTLPLRLLHAVIFEAGLLVATIPFIMWWLSMSFWQALSMDIGLGKVRTSP